MVGEEAVGLLPCQWMMEEEVEVDPLWGHVEGEGEDPCSHVMEEVEGVGHHESESEKVAEEDAGFYQPLIVEWLPVFHHSSQQSHI